MLGFRATTHWYGERVKQKAKQGTFKSLFQAAGYIRKVARSSIRRSKRPAAPGQPPHTQTGRIKNILFDVDKQRQYAVIGPSGKAVGPAASAHEFGGRFRGQTYAKRPFMGPALAKSLPRIPSYWTGSI